jgi:hypothetical protein
VYKVLIVLSVVGCINVFASDFASFFPASNPDIVQGEAIYQTSCAQCHSPTAFAKRAWKSSLTPVLLVADLSASSHPEMLEIDDLWHVTSFIWTQSSGGSGIQYGESLAFEAEKRMKQDALWLLLTKGRDIMNLQSRDWVLSHTEAEIDSVITGLAGDDYLALPPTDKAALIDYIYASYFTWPKTWRLE